MFWGLTHITAKQRHVLFGDCTRPTVVVCYWRFGTTYRSCRQLSNCLAFEDGTFRLFEMSIRNCHHRLRNIPEERASHLHSGGTLKSCKADAALVTCDATNYITLNCTELSHMNHQHMCIIKIWRSYFKIFWKENFENYIWTYKWQRRMENKIKQWVIYIVKWKWYSNIY